MNMPEFTADCCLQNKNMALRFLLSDLDRAGSLGVVIPQDSCLLRAAREHQRCETRCRERIIAPGICYNSCDNTFRFQAYACSIGIDLNQS